MGQKFSAGHKTIKQPRLFDQRDRARYKALSIHEARVKEQRILRGAFYFKVFPDVVGFSKSQNNSHGKMLHQLEFVYISLTVVCSHWRAIVGLSKHKAFYE